MPNAGIREKIVSIATRIYKAEGVKIDASAEKQLALIEKWGYGELPVCMAKTQYSFSHDPNLLGSPSGFTVPIKEFRLNAGAGFVVAICGNMMTMPGLPKRPAALDMDMDENGNLIGVFG
jgi:formate--tetrahydrofolate ligase